ncbi:MAG: hypothetical protein LH472_13635 [Pyrinomonadaceae bacterium]|nr:hypothetical protein [Pyrinomonadaceae bacterium]
MTKINYDNKTFASVQNSATGEVSNETVFYYHQKDDLVWAEHAGGAIRFGNLMAKVTENDCLEMRYQHLNGQGDLMTGKCFSTPEILGDGRIRLFEKWQWTSGDWSAGASIVEKSKRSESTLERVFPPRFAGGKAN